MVYCRCREVVKLFWLLLSPQSDRDLQQCEQLHCSLTGSDGGLVNLCTIKVSESLPYVKKLFYHNYVQSYKRMNILYVILHSRRLWQP
jgi:hypothetical protein